MSQHNRADNEGGARQFPLPCSRCYHLPALAVGFVAGLLYGCSVCLSIQMDVCLRVHRLLSVQKYTCILCIYIYHIYEYIYINVVTCGPEPGPLVNFHKYRGNSQLQRRWIITHICTQYI